jgi:hypothetical protein
MIRTALASSAAVLLLATAAAAPAFAYDPKEYAYAAGHMITPKDVAKPLTVKSKGFFNAGPDGGSFLCRKDDNSVNYPGGVNRYSIDYNAEDGKQPSITVNVQQYSSSVKAIKAFDTLKKAATTCAGPASGSDNWTDENGAPVVEQWSQLTTTGKVPLVTIVGVPSIFINTNYQNVVSNQESRYSSDNYTVYTLVNDVIISTSFFSGSQLNISGPQKKAVNQTAFNAVGAWVG